eukprot:8608315-Alexandrium_andersonii.AAC.1
MARAHARTHARTHKRTHVCTLFHGTAARAPERSSAACIMRSHVGRPRAQQAHANTNAAWRAYSACNHDLAQQHDIKSNNKQPATETTLV